MVHFDDRLDDRGVREMCTAAAAEVDLDRCGMDGQYDARDIADAQPLADKITTVAREIYRAGEVHIPDAIRAQLKQWEAMGYGQFPVCMAKTQFSFSTDPTKMGAPQGHEVEVHEVRLSAGAGFVVAVCGDIMTMPGLPKVPSAETIYLNETGQIEGLF